MKIIELYILKRVCIFFSTVLVASIGLSWTVQLLGKINFLTTNGQTFFAVLKFSSLVLPSAIPLVMPFALVIAIAQTLSVMNQDSELVAINASGTPRYYIWRPIMMLALVASVASFVVANFVVPSARLNMRYMVATAHSDIINVLIKEGTFRQLTDNIYLEIGERKPDGTIRHLFIADQRDPNLNLYYYAVEGAVSASNRGAFLVMRDGEVERQDNKTGDVSIIKFDTYTFDLSQVMPAGEGVTLFPKDQPLSYLFAPNPEDPFYQRKPSQFSAELHRRFTDWLYPMVFALIALAVAGDARSHREAHISAPFSAIAISLFVYWLGYFFGGRADNDLAYLPLLYIVPLGVMILMILMIALNCRLALPSRWIDQFHVKLDILKAKLSGNFMKNHRGDLP